ncbi:MAG: hypothetical protein KJ558_04165 [Gammaproteobacteria bacterium]|nr:hypothetical protein [Gammaproteobacteria bacterium]MBU1654018.1 hypothetical protein [Gammaproteobacteria bacterium]MBU1959687.1 hypothetical protein [Gammaproteobacteria bacterium]
MASATLLWIVLDKYGDFRRFRQTWLAVAGMSILIWVAGMMLVAVGAIPWGGTSILIILAMYGYGPVLHAAFDGRASHGTAILTIIVIGAASIATKEVLLALLAP